MFRELLIQAELQVFKEEQGRQAYREYRVLAVRTAQQALAEPQAHQEIREHRLP